MDKLTEAERDFAAKLAASLRCKTDTQGNYVCRSIAAANAKARQIMSEPKETE